MQDLSGVLGCEFQIDSSPRQPYVTLVTDLTDAHFDLSKLSATACLTVGAAAIERFCQSHFPPQLIWQFGDRQYQARRWSAAADWYLAGTHKAFGSIASLSHSKCFRKAALCHIQQGDYAIAAAVIRRCPDHEAATQYIKLLTAVHQGVYTIFGYRTR